MQQDHFFTRDVPLSDIHDTPEAVAGRLPTKGVGDGYAKFYTADVQDHARSAQMGRYCSRKVDMVRIIIPGDKHNIVERRVKESDKQKYSRAWEAFRKMEDEVHEGTLLETWPMVSRQQVEDLKYNGVHTVEQLAGVPDDFLGRLGLGSRMLRKHAEAFIETSKTGQVPAQLVARAEHAEQQVDLLTKQIASLSSKMEILAKAAGENIEDMGNPVQEAKMAVSQANQVNVINRVPDDYEKLGLPALKKLVADHTDAKVLTKADAIEILSEIKAKQDALAA